MGMRASVYGRQSSGKAKSIKEQLNAGRQVAKEKGWDHAGDYHDGTGASRHATKARSDWDRVIAGVQTKAFDVLILWESSRGDRTLSSWAQFLEDCRSNDVRIHVIADDHTYDMERPRDWKTLASAGVDAAAETDLLSIRVRRGIVGAADEGRPHGGPPPFGYRRTYDPSDGKQNGQEPVEPAASIVREIFDRLRHGDTINRISIDFEQRRVAGPNSETMLRKTIRSIAGNPAYAGSRTLRGVKYDGIWEPLVDAETFQFVQEILDGPRYVAFRAAARPGAQRHLLSYLGKSAKCGSLLRARASVYNCSECGCVSIRREFADQIVEAMICSRLAQLDFAETLTGEDDADMVAARAEVVELRSKLDEWRMSAARGETSPESLAVIESQLTGLIADAEKKIVPAGKPVLLREFIDPEVDVRERWAAMTVVARRRIVGALCEVKLSPSSRFGPYPSSWGPGEFAEHGFDRLSESRWVGDEKTWGDYELPGPV